MIQAVEHRPRRVRCRAGWWVQSRCATGYALLDALMRPSVVEARLVILDQPMHVLLVQNHEVVETLAPETAQEPLTYSIRLGRSESTHHLTASCQMQLY